MTQLNVQTHGIGQGESFSGRGNMDAAQKLIDDLEFLTVADFMSDHWAARGHRIKKRLDGCDIFCRAADHDEEVPLGSSSGTS